jgi:hypothetical protein
MSISTINSAIVKFFPVGTELEPTGFLVARQNEESVIGEFLDMSVQLCNRLNLSLDIAIAGTVPIDSAISRVLPVDRSTARMIPLDCVVGKTVPLHCMIAGTFLLTLGYLEPFF